MPYAASQFKACTRLGRGRLTLLKMSREPWQVQRLPTGSRPGELELRRVDQAERVFHGLLREHIPGSDSLFLC